MTFIMLLYPLIIPHYKYIINLLLVVHHMIQKGKYVIYPLLPSVL